MTLTVLVAEDEPIIAWDLCDTVAEAGFMIEGPHREAEGAIAASQKQKPALAIIDVELDDGNAFDLAKRLQADKVPIIFHTASLAPEAVTQKFPGATVLPKPCPPATMLAAVDAALDRGIGHE